MKGIFRFVVALVERFIGKLVVDFTMLIHLRGSSEVGGFCFLVSILTSLVSSFVSVHLYSTYYNLDEDNKLDADALQVILGSLCAVWIISLLAFISVVNWKYLRTFYNMDTGSEYNRKSFLSYKNDQEHLKAKILKVHSGVYAGWGEELLKPWTLKNWDRWEEERPAWFTDAWIECVPNEYIPYDFRVKYKKTKGRVEIRRRSSLAQVKTLLGVIEER
ncbi:hypothetical protein TrLO_g11347 [Triparma laevis f. longispina]|uniref:Uncharacterized protein n=1 Tax=Triparma laevis f. longispina TaxID=1714387 RepID=A0A9W7C124_9STRA|nr:hypothetical protein TrLO_g11347 [Triparma laevis f. longispina]